MLVHFPLALMPTSTLADGAGRLTDGRVLVEAAGS